MKQRTFAMLKPDAVKRRLTGKILSRFEERGLKVIAAKTLMISEDLAKTHYGEHSEKPFFADLVSYRRLRKNCRSLTRRQKRAVITSSSMPDGIPPGSGGTMSASGNPRLNVFPKG